MIKKRGKPALEAGELAVRINVSLPLSLAQRFRAEIPEKERSKLIAQLLQKHLDKQHLSEHID